MQDPRTHPEATSSSARADADRPRKALTLWDCVAIIVGIIVGAGIFETAPSIAGQVGHPWLVLFVWVLGGALSVVGALCYAELATAYPREGGDYVYLNRAYGPWAGYMFGWARLSIIQTGSIGLLAYVFARYATSIFPLGDHSFLIYAEATVIVLTVMNLIGTQQGKWTQIVLTTAKVLGVGGIIAVAFFSTAAAPVSGESAGANYGGLRLAMIFVLFTYGGWNEAAYVAAEVREPRRNIVGALLFGTLLVTLLYVLINAAYLYCLGIEGLKNSGAVATDVVATGLGGRISGESVATLIGILVMISALGAINGEIFTGSRISYAVGREHAILGLLGRWNHRSNSPTWALLIQGAITATLVWLAGRWGGANGFNNLVKFTAPVFWFFFLMTAISLFVLRYRDRSVERPFRVPLYPVIPCIFCLSCGFMLYSSIDYAMTVEPSEALKELPFAASALDGEKLTYNEESEQLSFKGVMSPQQRDRFLAHSSNPAYQQAVASLFRQSREQRQAALYAFSILIAGLPLYWISRVFFRKQPQASSA